MEKLWCLPGDIHDYFSNNDSSTQSQVKDKESQVKVKIVDENSHQFAKQSVINSDKLYIHALRSLARTDTPIKAMKSSPLLGPFGDSEFWEFSLLKI